MIYLARSPRRRAVSRDISFGHHGFGTMIHSNVEIGRGVRIWHTVTIAVRSTSALGDHAPGS